MHNLLKKTHIRLHSIGEIIKRKTSTNPMTGHNKGEGKTQA